MLQHPTQVGVDLVQRAVLAGMTNTSLAVVRDAVATALPHAAAADWLDRVLADTPAPLTNLVRELAMSPLPERAEREVTRYVRDITTVLIEKDLLRQKADLLGRLQRADASNREVYVAIQRELVRVEAERRNLREA